MKRIIVTEKPSVARDYASVLGLTNEDRHNGYFENDTYIITWCVGHLVEMVYPEVYDEKYKQWKLETLPFLPKKYKYDVIKEMQEQFNTIKRIYNRSDVSEILYAGDAGREGIYIQMLVKQEAGLRDGINEKVVWIDSQTADEIRRGIKDAKPLEYYKNLANSGYMRAIEDYALGINLSRALSIKYAKIISPTNHITIATGRVMSCVLGMVVERERAILDFKPTPFYKIVSHINVNGMDIPGLWRVKEGSPLEQSGKLYNNTGFKTEYDAKSFIQILSNRLKIVDIADTKERKEAPLLFNLAELQAECSKKMKISPDETLALAQSLYEKKLITYPRTDSRVLSTAVACEIDRNVKGLAGYNGELSTYVNRILSSGKVQGIVNSKYTDDSKVSDHYALIPTGDLRELKSLTDEETHLFDIIVRRFLAIFMPPAVYRKLRITEEDETQKEQFFVTASDLLEPGYMNILGIPEKREGLDINALDLHKGDVFTGEYSLEAGETKPPKRYTSGNMVLAMENAGQLIEDEALREQIKDNGIGTSATRAETIKKLIRIGYLNLNKKTQIITPGNLGFKIYEVLSLTVPSLLNPKMTANWEKGLRAVAEGKVTPREYLDKTEAFIRREVQNIKDKDISSELSKRIAGYMGKEDSKPAKFKVNAECYLDVPYGDAEKVKALGAWFDGERKAWYVPKGKDTTPFKQWQIDGVPKKPRKRIYLEVPYEDKDVVSKLGARWDGKDKKKWYIPDGVDTKPFQKWMKKKS